MPSPTNNLVQRIIVAAIAIPLVVVIIWVGGWALAVTLAILGVLGAHEVYDFGRRQGIEPLERTGWLAAAAIPLLAFWAKGPALYLGAIWLMVALVIAMARRGPMGRPLTSVSVTLFGCVYASGMLAFLVAIRHGGDALTRPAAYVFLTLFPLVITWISDTAAMAVGTAVGGVADPGEDERERSEEHTSELQSRLHLVCRLLLEKKKNKKNTETTSC